MNDEIFISGFALMVTLILAWGFRVLPAEKWQFIAAVPTRKVGGSLWSGINLTYYGFFSANAYVIAIMILCILLGAIHIPMAAILGMTVLILIFCVPASRIIAGWVEKKKYTFSIQAASFIGILIAPWVMVGFNHWTADFPGYRLEVIIILSAVVASYAIGEGLGRLACISFGCCYGKPLDELPLLLRRMFDQVYFVFYGSTKKIAYADGLEGCRMLPVQAITAMILCVTGIAGIYAFFKGYYATAFLGVIAVTQIWRFISEFVRADHRGGLKISAYQVMGLITILYCAGVVFIFPMASTPAHDVLDGLKTLWNPAVILFLQMVWIAIFVYTGRSRVTGSFVSFKVIDENV